MRSSLDCGEAIQEIVILMMWSLVLIFESHELVGVLLDLGGERNDLGREGQRKECLNSLPWKMLENMRSGMIDF